jgi:hypothetical protein
MLSFINEFVYFWYVPVLTPRLVNFCSISQILNFYLATETLVIQYVQNVAGGLLIPKTIPYFHVSAVMETRTYMLYMQ